MTMQTREWRNIDKSDWGDGPWQDEADKVQWRDDATGFPCLIVRGPLGALCGYVGVSQGHPWYGLNYSDIDVRVHGGATFSAFCRDHDDDGKGICHVVDDGEDSRPWWVGFDCCHHRDFSPRYYADMRRIDGNTARLYKQQAWEIYRDMQYVKREVEGMAKQAKDADGQHG